VGILGYMMDPGSWRLHRDLISGFFNPIYLPQLAFRAPMAMLMAGVLALFLNLFFTERGSGFRNRATRFVSLWMLVWTPPFLLGALWYRQVIPEFMARHLAVALGTIQFERLYGSILIFIGLAIAAVGAISLWGSIRPSLLPRWAWVVPMALVVVLTGQFERAREFIRKPYVLGGYRYANGIRVADYPLLMQEGVLPHSTFASEQRVTAGNRLEAGRDVFLIACSRCHTLNGVNSIHANLERMYGSDALWAPDAVDRYLATMFATRTFMPPFPGSVEERRALAEYLVFLQHRRDVAMGAQTVGVPRREPDR
jgi:hypothetical protein